MDVRNCKMCGRMFDYVGKPLCPQCNKKMEDKFHDVKQYIRENPASNMYEVAENNDVPVMMLKRWVREERLTFSKESGVVVNCEKCGTPILTGKYCEKCKKRLTNSLSGIYEEKKASSPTNKEQGAKMRFLK